MLPTGTIAPRSYHALFATLIAAACLWLCAGTAAASPPERPSADPSVSASHKKQAFDVPRAAAVARLTGSARLSTAAAAGEAAKVDGAPASAAIVSIAEAAPACASAALRAGPAETLRACASQGYRARAPPAA